MGLRILLTNFALGRWSGTEVYTRDLALALLRRGHLPMVFTSHPGEVASELQQAGVLVSSDWRAFTNAPDIIHGHHRFETMAALRRFPHAPAIFICHAHIYWQEGAPFHPHIYRYFGVSQVCCDRLQAEGVPANATQLLCNSVDTDRFLPRPPLPARPARALIFSNHARAGTQLPTIERACAQAGLTLDVVGSGVGQAVSEPADILGRYDLVFAKAKAAIEAMAVGCAVILCDFSGTGPLVTVESFATLRPMNFGFQALTDPLEPEYLLRQIARYDAEDSARVSQLIRTQASLDSAVTQLEDIYQQVISEHQQANRHAAPAWKRIRRTVYLQDAVIAKALNYWSTCPPHVRERLLKVPGMGRMLRKVKRMLALP